MFGLCLRPNFLKIDFLTFKTKSLWIFFYEFKIIMICNPEVFINNRCKLDNIYIFLQTVSLVMAEVILSN